MGEIAEIGKKYCIPESVLNDVHNILSLELERVLEYKDDAEELLKTTEYEKDIQLLKAEVLSYDKIIDKVFLADSNIEYHLHLCYNKRFDS